MRSLAFRAPGFGSRRDNSGHMLRPPIQPFAHLVGAGIDVIDAGHTRQPVAQDGFADLKRAAQAREAGAGGATQIVRGPIVYRGGVAGLARGKQTVTAGSDMAQLAPMVDQVETRVGKVPEQWLVDGGFPAHESTPWPARPSSMPILDARARTRSEGMVKTL